MSSDYGVRSNGEFDKKSIEQIRDDLQSNVTKSLGGNIELRASSPLQQIIDATSTEFATQWDASEAVYYSSFFQDATGEQLDKQLALAGFSRQTLRGATGEVVFQRERPAPSDVSIPEGTVVTTTRTERRPPIPFETTEEATILQDELSTDTVPIRALSPWETDVDEQWLGDETNVSADTITQFEEPVSGVDSVSNALPTGDPDEGFVHGRDEESDAEFKLRYENSLAEGGVSTVLAMQSSIFQFDERIESVRVDESRGTDGKYGPEVTVFAPELRDEDGDDLIAQAIVESRATGLPSIGEQSGIAETDSGERTERFNRSLKIPIGVDIDLTTSDTFPADGHERIEENLIQFIGGFVGDNIFPGLQIGEDVIYDQVKQRVMEIQGVIQADVNIGVQFDAGFPWTMPQTLGEDSGDFGTGNIEISDQRVAMTDEPLIEIE